MFYERVMAALVAADVRFVIVGGVAAILHGVPRTTADLDLVVDLSQANLQKLIDVMSSLGFRPRAPFAATDLLDESKRRSWIAAKGMKAFTYVSADSELSEVDILIDVPIAFAELVRGAVAFEAGSLRLLAASVDALIEMKKDTGRAQDESDVDALRRLRAHLGGDDGES